jgi:riboflavin kinase/FMN adenylyltransferase
MKFQTTTTTGLGRGKSLGFPTINMIIPDNLPLVIKQGVYAGRAVIAEEKYNGVIYYGPAVTLGEGEPTLEIYLLDTAGLYVGEGQAIEIEVLKYIRPVMQFEIPELLVDQMNKDVDAVRIALHI